MKRLFFILAIACAGIAAGAQNGIQVQAHKVVSADEQFNVTFIIEGKDRPSDFTWEPGEDFYLVWGPQQGHTSSVQIINGKRTQSAQTTYSYVLKPSKEGKFTLPAARAKVNGQEITSRQFEIEVLASGNAQGGESGEPSSGSAPASGQNRQNGGIAEDDIILSVSVDRDNVVVGEPVIATIKLYSRVNVSGFESASYPSFNGFWSQALEAPKNIEFVRETYRGQLYSAVLLGKYVLIPQQSGQIGIDPAELMCLVSVRVSPRGTSIFDGFFDEYRTVRKKAVSKPLVVNVSPLPAGAPASFAGGVGEYSISASLSKDSLKTHEAASLVITVSGKGNVALLETPKVNFPPDMEVYDTKVTGNTTANGMAGSKRYEYPFIPRSHGDFVIEPVKYSYYDVNSKKYVTLETAPVELKVARGNETESEGVVVPSINRKDVKNLDSDIRFISVRNPSLKVKGQFFVESLWFWLSVSAVILCGICIYVAMRRIAVRRADVAGTKTRKATKMALKRLRMADEFLRSDLPSAFYEELHKALLGFISDKLSIQASDLSHDRISDALAGRGVPQENIDAFSELLDACEFARYAPDAGHDAMAAHYKAAADVISTIDSNMKSKKNTTGGRTVAMMLLMLVLPASLCAAHDREAADSLWNAANNAYSEGRWSDSASDYIAIGEMGLESAALYCNTGNAFFKEGNLPMAIVYYERALKLDPAYSDAKSNLELVNGRIYDRIDPVPGFFLSTWMRHLCYAMDSDSWAIAFIVFLACAVAMVLLFLLADSVAGKQTGFFVGILMILLSVCTLSFSVWQKNDCLRDDMAIVMRPVVPVKSSPSSEASKDLFILHEGTKVTVLDQVGSWSNVSLADGRQGWLPSESLEII